MGENKRPWGWSWVHGYTESCSWPLKAELCHGEGWAQSSVWHPEHHLAAEAVEREAKLAGGGRGTASPLYWLIWTKSTSVHTKEHRRTNPYNPQPWQLPGATSPSKAHFLKLRGAQGHRAGGSQIKYLEEGTPDAGFCVWLLPHFRTAEVHLWSSSTWHYCQNNYENKEPQALSAFLCCRFMYTHPCPAVAHRHPQPLLALICLSQCLPSSAHGPGLLSATLLHHKASKEQFRSRHFLYSFSTKSYLIFSFVSEENKAYMAAFPFCLPFSLSSRTPKTSILLEAWHWKRHITLFQLFC